MDSKLLFAILPFQTLRDFLKRIIRYMRLTGWGRYPVIKATGQSFETEEQLQRALQRFEDCIVYAKGGSYGDSALSERVILSRRFNKIIHFDSQEGVVTCESGVTLAELIEAFLPRGWFLAVTPGTKFITVGGAIASDVHGKNHHKVGCFSNTVLSFDLFLPSGEIIYCSHEVNRPLFLATCGGMGLTGVILKVTLRLMPVKSAFIRETRIRCRNLEEIFQLFEANQAVPYSVAWIDCLAGKDNIGRSILILGEHAESGRLENPPGKTFSIPVDLPSFFLNRYSIRLFNYLYYHKAPDSKVGALVPLEDFYYPLDKILNWNRMYGSRGFTQYQFVLPKEVSFAGLKQILAKIVEAGLGSFLGVLKLFGPENDNLLSFPEEGYTLAIDFKINRKLFPFLEELDRMVLEFGGRLYLAKDVRMSGETFRQGYPRWEDFVELRKRHALNRNFKSLQSKRLGI
jgi:decaprenylphospho-beta-D-ribofuranose 2-oxidase